MKKGHKDYKLGLVTTPDIVKRMYIDERKSMPQISIILGVSTSAIKAYMKKYGIPTRNHSESAKGNKSSLGRKLSKRHREILRNKMIGNSPSEETRKKMSLAKKLNPPKNLYKNGHIGLKKDKHPQWIKDRNELKTVLHDAIRRLEEYDRWRNSVYERDNYRCQLCFKESDCDLQCHHIIPLSNLIKLTNISTDIDAIRYPIFWDVNNGITLCKNCHSKIRKSENKFFDYFNLSILLNDSL